MGTRRGPSKRARVPMNEKNGRMAHCRMVGRGILRNHERNNNSPAAGSWMGSGHDEYFGHSVLQKHTDKEFIMN
jgi:hypothetical protein